MKKTVALLLAMLMGLFALAGCGGGDAGGTTTTGSSTAGPAAGGDKIIIGFSSNANDENMNIQMESFKQFVADYNAAGNQPQVEAHITVADSSVEKQISDVESLIELGCQAIYLHSVDVEGILPAIDACEAAGVQVLEARNATHDWLVKYVGADEWMMAEMAFSWYKERMDADPEMVLKMGLLYGLASQTQQLVRVDHLVTLLQEEYGEERVQVVDSMPCDWDAQKAMECMENWLQKYSDGEMNCIVAAGAMMSMGAAQAVSASGANMDDWLFTTTDATSDVLYGIKQGIADMTVGIRADMDGPAAAELCIKMVKGEFTDKEFHIGPDILAIIDETNIDEWYKGE